MAGFHHHAAMTLLAYGFLLLERQRMTVERDMVTACTWFSLATYSGHGAARNSMQFCARDLNEKQRNEYFERAQAWLAARKKK